jgi:hypothetical protein
MDATRGDAGEPTEDAPTGTRFGNRIARKSGYPPSTRGNAASDGDC